MKWNKMNVKVGNIQCVKEKPIIIEAGTNKHDIYYTLTHTHTTRTYTHIYNKW